MQIARSRMLEVTFYSYQGAEPWLSHGSPILLLKRNTPLLAASDGRLPVSNRPSLFCGIRDHYCSNRSLNMLSRKIAGSGTKRKLLICSSDVPKPCVLRRSM